MAGHPQARLNEFFQRRHVALEHVERCPACEQAGPFAQYKLIKGKKGSEGEGVWMPSVRCPRCRLVFLNPRIPADDAAAFYRESPGLLAYFTSGEKEKLDAGPGFVPFAEMLERHLTIAERDMFDFGCGVGAFMRLMAQRGFRVMGAEISPSVAEAARSRAGFEVLTAGADEAIDTLNSQGRTFALVTLIHTFEHLSDPLRFLDRVRSILRPGGLLGINVPNIRYFLVPVDRMLGTNLAAGIWDSVSHFSYFSLPSLKQACEKMGYEVMDSDSRLLVQGRVGLVGAVDRVLSWGCRALGGVGSNIAVVARRS